MKKKTQNWKEIKHLLILYLVLRVLFSKIYWIKKSSLNKEKDNWEDNLDSLLPMDHLSLIKEIFFMLKRSL